MYIFSKKAISSFLFIFFIGLSILFFNPQKSHAVFVPVIDAAVVTAIETAAAAMITAEEVAAGAIVVAIEVDVATREAREFGFDAIARIAANTAIKKLSQQTINWVNSGFDGNPVYSLNLDFLFNQLCASTLTELFDEVGASDIDPIAQRAIARSLYATQPCSTHGKISGATISDAVLGSFFTDLEDASGWHTWRQVTMNPHNNAYGQYLKTSAEFNSRLHSVINNKQEQLSWGQGFLSQEKCSMEVVEPGTPPRKVCHVVTPGKLIEDSLSDILGSDLKQLELADEVDEILGALVNQLFKQAFTSLHGLFDNGNFNDQLIVPELPTYASSDPFLNTQKSAIEGQITLEKHTIETYKHIKEESYVLIRDTKTLVETLPSSSSIRLEWLPLLTSYENALLIEIGLATTILNGYDELENELDHANSLEKILIIKDRVNVYIAENKKTIAEIQEAEKELQNLTTLTNNIKELVQ